MVNRAHVIRNEALTRPLTPRAVLNLFVSSVLIMNIASRFSGTLIDVCPTHAGEESFILTSVPEVP